MADKDKNKPDPSPDGNIFDRMNSPMGLKDDGTLFTEDNLPWYRDENGNIVFKGDLENLDSQK